MRKPAVSTLLAVFILACLLGLSLLGALYDAPIADEPVHIAAGASYLATGDFRMNPEHPPLVKLLAAIPVLIAGARVQTDGPAWKNTDKWVFGSQFVFENRIAPRTIVFLARLPMILLTLAFGLMLSLWVKKKFGAWPAVVLLAVYAFDPMTLSHGHYVTTDLAAAFTFALVLMSLDRFFALPSKPNGWLVALFMAIAMLTKFSLVILWPILVLAYLARWWHAPRTPLPWSVRGLFKLLGQCCIVSFVLAFIVYGFEIKKPYNDPIVHQLYAKRAAIVVSPDYQRLTSFEQTVLKQTDPATVSGQRLETLLKSVPIPAYSYLSGLIAVTGHNYTGHSHSFLGQTGDKGSIWYFPVAWFVKTPMAIAILTLLGLVAFIRKRAWIQSFTPLLLTIAGLTYIASAITSNLNIGYRHLMPVLPVLAGLVTLAVIRAGRSKSVWQQGVVFGLLGFGLLSPLRAFPHMLAYYTELIGGTQNGHAFMLDSNLDWGQSDREASDYVRANNISLAGTTRSGPDDRGAYGFSPTPVPTDTDLAGHEPPTGWYLISGNALLNGNHAFVWLEKRTPERVFGHALYLYQVK